MCMALKKQNRIKGTDFLQQTKTKTLECLKHEFIMGKEGKHRKVLNEAYQLFYEDLRIKIKQNLN